jgi:hypothetical protein
MHPQHGRGPLQTKVVALDPGTSGRASKALHAHLALPRSSNRQLHASEATLSAKPLVLEAKKGDATPPAPVVYSPPSVDGGCDESGPAGNSKRACRACVTIVGRSVTAGHVQQEAEQELAMANLQALPNGAALLRRMRARAASAERCLSAE